MVLHFIWNITVIILSTGKYIHTCKPLRKSGIILILSLLHNGHLVVVSILKCLRAFSGRSCANDVCTNHYIQRSSKQCAREGDVVAIFGVGGLGHLGIQFASKMGFKTIAIGRGKDGGSSAQDNILIANRRILQKSL
jgi:hypothetical protein